MKSFYPQKEPFNFLGLVNQNPKKAKFWILPVPYETTVFNLSGTKDGPEAIISASRCIELFDEELQKEFPKNLIFTLSPISLSKNSPKEAIEQIKKATKEILKRKKIPVLLGGEHTISLGAILALKEF
ncbi:arginase family protein, partial [Candidatus Parcubacteria bacterium]|nr:arginase family protein [Candidatus Parcubacteria bacterium]